MNVFANVELIQTVMNIFSDIWENFEPKADTSHNFENESLWDTTCVSIIDFMSSLMESPKRKDRILKETTYLKSLTTLFIKNRYAFSQSMWNFSCFAVINMLDNKNLLEISCFNEIIDEISTDLQKTQSSNYGSLLVILNLIQGYTGSDEDFRYQSISYILSKISKLHEYIINILNSCEFENLNEQLDITPIPIKEISTKILIHLVSYEQAVLEIHYEREYKQKNFSLTTEDMETEFSYFTLYSYKDYLSASSKFNLIMDLTSREDTSCFAFNLIQQLIRVKDDYFLYRFINDEIIK